jgi:hypothetical protein
MRFERAPWRACGAAAALFARARLSLNLSLVAGSHPTIECARFSGMAERVDCFFLALTHRVRKLSITGLVVAIAVMDILRA